MSHPKSGLRRELRQRRKSITDDARRQQQAAVQLRLRRALEEHPTKRTGFYLACGSELDLAAEDTDWKGLTEVLAPVLARTELRFAPAQPPWGTSMVGTREPVTENSLAVSKLDLLLMPLLACDHSGVRLGQGGGWYDRTLDKPQTELPLCVGIGFDEQLVEHLPREAHDQTLDIFLSARHSRAFTPRGKQWLIGF